MLPAMRNGSGFRPIPESPIERFGALLDGAFDVEDRLPLRAWTGLPISAWQDEDHVHIEVEVPGVAEQDLDLSIHKDMLTIRGERKPEEGRSFLFDSRSYGRFEQTIRLTDPVDADAARASLANGVLSIDLPKRPDAKPKTISLRAS